MRLKNILIIALAMVSITTFTGCIDIIEEVFLNKNGSGKYTMRMDMSGMMGMIKMMSEMGEMMPGDEEDTEESEKEDAGLDAMLEQGVDSVMYLKDASADILKQFDDNPGFADKVNMRMNVNPDENIFQIDFNLDFEDMDDIDYFFKNFENIMAMMSDGEDEEGSELDMLGMGGGGMGAGSPLGGIMGGDGLTRYFDMTKRTLIRRDASQQETEDMTEEMGAEEQQMMEMMFEDAKYKMIYHMPGKVKKMTNKDATLSADKKTVMLEGNLMDYMNGEFKVANIIKFGKK